MGNKINRITINVIIYVFILVYAEIRSFIVTFVLHSWPTNYSNVLIRMLTIKQLDNVRAAMGGFGKTQLKCDN